MKTDLKRFLKFNGKNIYFLSRDGQYWIALKPICDALGVDYIRQFKNTKEDEFLGRVLSKQTMHDTSGRLQNMVCLPEKYIYGWVFSLRSDSPQLKEYKMKCYDVLYDYFNGSMVTRISTLHTKSEAELEAEHWAQEVKKTDAYRKQQEALLKVKESKRKLEELDEYLGSGQLNLFTEN